MPIGRAAVFCLLFAALAAGPRPAWAAAAREKVEREFDAVKQAERLEALYARLLADR